jgi:protein CpxP
MGMGKNLGLTDAQKGQAKAIFQSNRESVKPIMENLRAERKNLHALMFADTVDEAAIRAETAKIAAIQADLNVDRAKAMSQFRAILTPDQIAKLKTSCHKPHNHGHGAKSQEPAK